MGIEIFCHKKVIDDSEHIYLCLTLNYENNYNFYIKHWKEDSNTISIIYDPNKRELSWGGWSCKRVPDEDGYSEKLYYPRTKSYSWKKLERNLKLYKPSLKEIKMWEKFWDNNSYWTAE